jgi:uncharacterized heparinase superfamily protein
MSLSRLFHTVRHLTERQIIGQVGVRLRPLWENPESFRQQEIPAFPGCRWQLKSDFLAPGPQSNKASDMVLGEFAFLNTPFNLGWPPIWERDNIPKLWQYNLHYFEWLWTLDYEKAVEAVQDWIVRHALHKGAVGWEPYPSSLRLMNWLGVFWGKMRQQTELDTAFCDELWQSVFLQTEWLFRHMETHIMGNHLLENAAALVICGSCFTGEIANRWRRRGVKILAEQLLEQIPSDGLHFERSPMYHLRITYLLILLRNLELVDLNELIEAPLERMLSALLKTCHPDGRIALFNDSAFEIYNEPGELIKTAKRLLPPDSDPSRPPHGAWALPDAGYYGFRDESTDSYVIFDAGAIGPDYIPGHAHGDIFSFELSLNGHRVVVDSGVHDYEKSEMRRYCRSTKAHNTVEIDNQDQCEFWGAFRVARRGGPQDVIWEPSDEGFRMAGWHDGYMRLPGRPRHYREAAWSSGGVLEVKDRIVSSRSVDIVSRIHLDHRCTIEEIREDHVIVAYPGGKFQVSCCTPAKLAVEKSFYSPEFGKKIENAVLTFSISGINIALGFQIKRL